MSMKPQPAKPIGESSLGSTHVGFVLFIIFFYKTIKYAVVLVLCVVYSSFPRPLKKGKIGQNRLLQRFLANGAVGS